MQIIGAASGGAASSRVTGRGGFLARCRTYLAIQYGWKAAGWAALLGALSALALPPLYVLPVLLISVPGLLILIGTAPNWRSALWRGFCFGWAHHVVGLYWITSAIIVEAADYWWLIPFAVPGLALILAPFIAVPCAGARLVPAGGPRVLLLAGLWGFGDLARQFVGTGFPWDPWGAVWTLPGRLGDIMIQPAAWVSVHGLTMATLLLAATPLLGRRWVAIGAGGLALWAALGWARLNHLPVSASPHLAVVLAQGDIPQNLKWNRAMTQQVLDHYLDISAEGLRRAGNVPAVLVWPESAFPGLLVEDPGARVDIAALNRLASGPTAKPAVANFIGSIRFASAAEGSRPYNSLVAVRPDGRIAGIYDKWHLVPFGEYAPTWLPFAVRLVPGGGFIRGAGPTTLHIPGIPPVGPLICYEAIFPAQVIDEADRPDWIVNITNDAWFGNSAGPRQHWESARLRAVEEGIPLLRAANTGISGGFDSFGHEIGHLGLGRTGAYIIFLPGHLSRTFFSRVGLLIPMLIAGLLSVTGWLLKAQFYKR